MCEDLCAANTALAVRAASRNLLGQCMRASSEIQCVSPVSCWTSGLLKGVMKRLVCTLSSTRDAAMTCSQLASVQLYEGHVIKIELRGVA